MDIQEVGKRIKARRTALGLTQPELATRMGTENNAPYISEIENGKRDLSITTLGRFAIALECGTADLLPQKLMTCDNSHPHPVPLEEVAA